MSVVDRMALNRYLISRDVLRHGKSCQSSFTNAVHLCYFSSSGQEGLNIIRSRDGLRARVTPPFLRQQECIFLFTLLLTCCYVWIPFCFSHSCFPIFDFSLLYKNKFCSVGSSMEGPCKQTLAGFAHLFSLFLLSFQRLSLFNNQSSPFDRIWSFYLHMCSALRIWKKLPCSRDETPENNRNMSSLILNEGFEFFKNFTASKSCVLSPMWIAHSHPFSSNFYLPKNFNHDVTRSFKYFLCVQLTLSLCSHLK